MCRGVFACVCMFVCVFLPVCVYVRLSVFPCVCLFCVCSATGIILHTDSPASLADSQRRAKAQCYLLKAQISFLSLLELQEETMEHRDALTALICV